MQMDMGWSKLSFLLGLAPVGISACRSQIKSGTNLETAGWLFALSVRLVKVN